MRFWHSGQMTSPRAGFAACRLFGAPRAAFRLARMELAAATQREAAEFYLIRLGCALPNKGVSTMTRKMMIGFVGAAAIVAAASATGRIRSNLRMGKFAGSPAFRADSIWAGVGLQPRGPPVAQRKTEEP
jgi:hypothetical protein